MSYLRIISNGLQSIKTFKLNNNLINLIINKKSFSSATKLKTVKDIKRAVLKNLDPDHSRINKDVLIYQNENSAFFRKLFFMNAIQFCFWIYIANFAFVLYLKKPKNLSKQQMSQRLKENDKNENYFERSKILFRENWTQVLMGIMFVTFGHISMALLSLFTIRSIRYIILRSGGQKVRITCFSLIGATNRYRHHDIPLDKISAIQDRNSAGNYIPIKIKGKWLYYLVDKKGHFFHPTLFDETVGVFRILK
jgi:hypothetical protein